MSLTKTLITLLFICTSIHAYSQHNLIKYYNGDIKLTKEERAALCEEIIATEPSNYLLSLAHFQQVSILGKSISNSDAYEKYDHALHYLQNADTTDSYLHYAILVRQGNIFYYYELYNEATKKYKEALPHSYAFSRSEGISTKYNVALSLANYDLDKALSLFFEVLIEAKDWDQEDRQARIFNQIGIVFQNKNELDIALKYFEKALEIVTSNKTKANVLHNFGHVSYLRGNFLNQEKWLLEALKVSKGPDRFISLMDLGECYIKLGRDEEAKKVLAEAEGFYNNQQLRERNIKVFQWLESASDLPLKYNYVKIQLEQHLKIKETQNQLSKLIQAEQDELLSLSNNNLNEKTVEAASYKTWAVSGFATASFLLAFWVYQKKRTKKAFEKNQTAMKIAELKALKSQINPHFLFNALNSIQSFILEDKKNVAEDYLVKYGKLMRMILDHSNELTVPLNEELESINLYMELEKVRLRNGFDFDIQLEQSIDPYITQVPSMVIQPLIENAIWHGISPMGKKGKITLKVTSKNELVEITVIDNGVGFDTMASSKIEHSSKGVQLVKERLQLLTDKGDEKSAFEIKSEVGSGTTCIIRFSNDLS